MIGRRPQNTSYSTPIEIHLRVQRTMFPVVTTLTLLANVVFAVCGLAKTLSIYTLLGYLALLQLLFEIVDKRGGHLPPLADEPDLQLPYFDDVLPYVGVWLLWWTATTLLFHAMVVFTHGLPAQLGLLALVSCFVALRYIVRMPANNFWVIMLRFALRVLSCAMLFLPSRDWAPQHVAWLATVVRVTMFFFAALALNTVVVNYRERCADNVVLVWWLLVTPFYISFVALPLLLGVIFVTQTKVKFFVFEDSGAKMETSVSATTPPSAVVATTAAAHSETPLSNSDDSVGGGSSDVRPSRQMFSPTASAGAHLNNFSRLSLHPESVGTRTVLTSTSSYDLPQPVRSSAPRQQQQQHQQQQNYTSYGSNDGDYRTNHFQTLDHLPPSISALSAGRAATGYGMSSSAPRNTRQPPMRPSPTRHQHAATQSSPPPQPPPQSEPETPARELTPPPPSRPSERDEMYTNGHVAASSSLSYGESSLSSLSPPASSPQPPEQRGVPASKQSANAAKKAELVEV